MRHILGFVTFYYTKKGNFWSVHNFKISSHSKKIFTFFVADDRNIHHFQVSKKTKNVANSSAFPVYPTYLGSDFPVRSDIWVQWCSLSEVWDILFKNFWCFCAKYRFKNVGKYKFLLQFSTTFLCLLPLFRLFHPAKCSRPLQDAKGVKRDVLFSPKKLLWKTKTTWKGGRNSYNRREKERWGKLYPRWWGWRRRNWR